MNSFHDNNEDQLNILIDNIRARRAILFIGPDLEFENSRNPFSCSMIAKELIDDCGCGCSEAPLAKSFDWVAGHYEEQKGREQLISFIKNMTDNADYEIPDIYMLIKEIPFRAVITTNYDISLLKAYERTKSYRFINNIQDLGRLKDNYTEIIQLCGDLNEDSFVFTDNDYDRLFNINEVKGKKLKEYLTDRCWVFIGWNPSTDTFFDKFYAQVLNKIQFHASSHIIWNDKIDRFTLATRIRAGFSIQKFNLFPFFHTIQNRIGVSKCTKRMKEYYRWKYLDSYDENDHNFFFGRNEIIIELFQIIANCQLTIISGDSGIGKTSLIKAGLIKKIKDEYGDKAIAVYIKFFVPTYTETIDSYDPTEALKLSIIDQLEKIQNEYESNKKITKMRFEVIPELKDVKNKVDFNQFLEKVFQITGPDIEIFLFIDQFEVFFSQTARELNETYAKSLLSPLEQFLSRGKKLKIIFSLREDYRKMLFSYRNVFAALIKAETKYIPGLTIEQSMMIVSETNKCIEQSMMIVSETNKCIKMKQINENLVKIILNDLITNRKDISPSALQIVFHILHEESRTQPLLKLDEIYKKLQKVDGILNYYLNKTIERIEYSDLIRLIFLSLISTEGTSNPRTEFEIIEFVNRFKKNCTCTNEKENSNTYILKTLNYLVERRIIVRRSREKYSATHESFPVTSEKTTIYEVIHENLTQADLIQKWFKEINSEILLFFEKLELAIKGWELDGFFSVDKSTIEDMYKKLNTYKNEIVPMLSEIQWHFLVDALIRKDVRVSDWFFLCAFKQLEENKLENILINIEERSVKPILQILENNSIPKRLGKGLLDALLSIKSKEFNKVYSNKSIHQIDAMFTIQ